MHTLLHGLLLGIALTAVMTVTTIADPPADAVKPPKEDLAKLAAGNNAFALDVYAKVKHDDKNEFISPYSISSALAMTCAGARGLTAEEMIKVMHLDLPTDRLHAAFRALTTGLNADGKNAAKNEGKDAGRNANKDASALLVANALWGRKDFEFHPDYLKLIETDYDGKLTTLDFAKAPEPSRQTINKWVEEKTREKIKDLLPKGMINDQTRLVLTNAIYFKGAWVHTFNKAQTKREDFQVNASTKSQVDMMHQQDRFGYFENEDLQALEMHYRGPSVSMVVLLPKKADGLVDLEKNLDAGKLTDWLARFAPAKVQVSLPKFRIEGEYALADQLKALGMSAAFSAADADFTGMTDSKIWISAVIHKTFVAVDEEGTEAAAATAIGMVGSAMPKPEEPKVFTADHPFLFLIRDGRSGTILFLGRFVKPGDLQSSKAKGVATPAQAAAAKVGLFNLGIALDAFEVDHGRFPTTEEGLLALVERPKSIADWHGPYVNKIPKDPWGHEFVYRCPGNHNQQAYDLSSLGADGQESDDDITNWKTDSAP